MSEGRESTNQWIRVRAQEFASELGLDSVPMEDPDFDFYGWGMAHIRKQYGLSGQNQEHMVYDVITMAFFSVGRGSTIDSYPAFYRNKSGISFDEFFRMAFMQKAIETWNSWNTRKRRPVGEYAIVPGGSSGWKGWKEEIPGEWIGGLGDPAANLLTKEDREKLLYEEIPRMLADQKNGKVLEKCWKLMLQGKTIQESMDAVNRIAKQQSSFWAPQGGYWCVSTINRMRNTAKKLVLEYFREHGLESCHLMAEKNYPVIFRHHSLLS